MKNPQLIGVYDLPTANNVCNQILREVISLPKFSMAHVTMNTGNVSLLHKHSKMTEIYFIQKGKGILYHGDSALSVRKGAYFIIPPHVQHKLKNTGNTDLEHLVFALPPFDPKDIQILDDDNRNIVINKYGYNKEPFEAKDGAMIYELIESEERKKLDFALAVGFLPKGRKALAHHHDISEELYYFLSGEGRVRVGREYFDVKKGSLVYIPVNNIHALENKSDSEELEVLCVSSPAYTEKDFIFD